MTVDVIISDYVSRWSDSPFAHLHEAPWTIIQSADALIRSAIQRCSGEYLIADDVALHRSSVIEDGAVVKGPALIGPDCLVASGAYLRGGVYLEKSCIIGPNAELKSSILFQGAKLAHLNFVGDSILGDSVNVEAGAIVANYRNELGDKRIRISHRGSSLETGVEKFGALMGDGTRVGANAVIAPGALLAPGSIVPRLALVDQYPIER